MGRNRSTKHLAWLQRTANTTDGRELRWVFSPNEPYPMCFAGRVDGKQVTDDVLLDHLRAIGHGDAARHRPNSNGASTVCRW